MFPSVIIQDKKIASFIFGQEIDEETFQHVEAFDQFINIKYKKLIVETVPTYHMVTVFFNKEIAQDQSLLTDIIYKWKKFEIQLQSSKSRRVTIPVCYDALFALDLERVAEELNLTTEQVIKKHSEPTYKVYLIGFLPGFPYLGGLNKELFVPRLDKPRKSVEKGSVGIGGRQTGIYPVTSPGGWNIIGKTPIDLFDVNRNPAFLLQPGDQITFKSISIDDFYNVKENVEKNPQYILNLIDTKI
ncbi:5-oxoprolinase subunit PxpB [Ureibacillus massiliensis]|uniref:5-oxoprolinase subunit PxpB n=1 Tax=Ureibacillus massiliensis TaxID=292806 RepID=UPI00068C5472|nr:5-oxoprolinase subunit PxpB [Ureibacillus massiliensis]